MLARSVEDLQRMMDGLNRTTKAYEMEINTKNAKIMKVSWEEGEYKNMNLTIDGVEKEQVTEFCYLGSRISDDAKKLRKG